MGNITTFDTVFQNGLKKGIYFLLLLSILSSIGLSTEQSEKQKAFLSITDILDAWEAGYSSIHSMKVKYIEDITMTDPNDKDSIFRYTVNRIEEGQKFHLEYSTSTPDSPKSESLGNIEAAFDGKVSTYCDYKIQFGRIDNGISTKGYSNVNSLGRFMLLSRYYFDPNYPDGETYFAYWVRDSIIGSRTSNDYKVNVRPELETVLGELCHVVELSYGKRVDRFWLAHNKGMCPMKFEKLFGQGVLSRMEVLKIAKVITDIGEVWYPVEMEQVTGYKDSKTGEVEIGKYQTYKCQVQEFAPYLANIAPGTFRVEFPDGVTILDNVLNITYKKGEVKNAFDELNNGKDSSNQSSLESNKTKDTTNNSNADVESQSASPVSKKEPNSKSIGILGDTHQFLNKIVYVVIASLEHDAMAVDENALAGANLDGAKSEPLDFPMQDAPAPHQINPGIVEVGRLRAPWLHVFNPGFDLCGFLTLAQFGFDRFGDGLALRVGDGHPQPVGAIDIAQICDQLERSVCLCRDCYVADMFGRLRFQVNRPIYAAEDPVIARTLGAVDGLITRHFADLDLKQIVVTVVDELADIVPEPVKAALMNRASGLAIDLDLRVGEHAIEDDVHTPALPFFGHGEYMFVETLLLGAIIEEIVLGQVAAIIEGSETFGLPAGRNGDYRPDFTVSSVCAVEFPIDRIIVAGAR